MKPGFCNDFTLLLFLLSNLMVDVTADSRKRNVMINCCSGEITFRNFVSFFSNIGVTILSTYASLCRHSGIPGNEERKAPLNVLLLQLLSNHDFIVLVHQHFH